MQLVVDATVLFAAIIGRAKTYKLFFEDRLKLVATSYLLEEFNKNIRTLSKICNKPEPEVKEIFEMLKERIEIFPIVKFSPEIESRAEKLAPHAKDAPYFALALYLGSAIWTREEEFDAQNEVKIYFTEELVDMFGIK